MSKFKVGDRVWAKSDEEIAKIGSSVVYLSDAMRSYCGKTHIVTRCDSRDDTYRLDGATFGWWDEQWLEPAAPNLKPGYVVRNRKGELCLVMPTETMGIIFLHSEGLYAGCYNLLTDYNRDDLCCGPNSDLDIVEIWGYTDTVGWPIKVTTQDRKLLWKREEKPAPKKMTVSEVCKALGYDIEIVKEDSDNA